MKVRKDLPVTILLIFLIAATSKAQSLLEKYDSETIYLQAAGYKKGGKWYPLGF